MKHIKVEQNVIDNLYENKKLEFDKYDLSKGYYHIFSYNKHSKENELWDGYSNSLYYYPNGLVVFYDKNKFHLIDRKKKVSKHQGKNPFQWVTIDALFRDEIELSILTGVAGSGKTFIALAYALQVVGDEEHKYNNIVLSRPKQDLERDEGFLPGEEDAKILPYMMPFYDNARSLGEIQKFRRMVSFGGDTGGIIFQPLEKIKGRSFEKSIIILDEAEDMRYRELESSLTRINDCETIICGDIEQVDDNTFSRNNIPLVYAINKMKEQDFFFHIDNPVTCRKGKVTKFVTKNFSYEEYKKQIG